MRLSGSFERDTDGSLMNNPLLKKFYSIADAIGFGGGFDTNGNWVSKIDEPIENIETFLNNNFLSLIISLPCTFNLNNYLSACFLSTTIKTD